MRASFLIGAAFIAAPASAQAPLAAPSPAAMELAALIPPGQDPSFARSRASIERDIRSRLLGTWTSRGAGCDPANAECRAIADEMAKAFVETELDYHRRRAQLVYAYRLGDLMTEAQMRESSRFLRTASGRKLAEVLESLATSPIDPARSRQIAERLAVALPQPRNDYADRFFERTKHLPRRPVPVPPAPPRPNPPHSD
jgi:hypothetical protein